MTDKTLAPGQVVMAGDWHGNTPWAVSVIGQAGKILEGEPIKLVLQLGDFGVWYGGHGDKYLSALAGACAENHVQVWFIDGNHECFPRLRKEFRGQTARYRDLVWLERGSRWTWHGKKWLALGGATSLDKDFRTEGTSWFADEEITEEQAEKIAGQGKADVMLTHDCPSGVVHSFPDFDWPPREITRAEKHSRRLQKAVNIVRPAHLVHGHLHICYQRDVFMPYGECMVTGLARDGDESNWFVVDTETMEFLPHA